MHRTRDSWWCPSSEPLLRAFPGMSTTSGPLIHGVTRRGRAGPSATRHEPAQLAGPWIPSEVRRTADRDVRVGESGSGERNTELPPKRLDVERALGDGAHV